MFNNRSTFISGICSPNVHFRATGISTTLGQHLFAPSSATRHTRTRHKNDAFNGQVAAVNGIIEPSWEFQVTTCANRNDAYDGAASAELKSISGWKMAGNSAQWAPVETENCYVFPITNRYLSKESVVHTATSYSLAWHNYFKVNIQGRPRPGWHTYAALNPVDVGLLPLGERTFGQVKEQTWETYHWLRVHVEAGQTITFNGASAGGYNLTGSLFETDDDTTPTYITQAFTAKSRYSEPINGTWTNNGAERDIYLRIAGESKNLGDGYYDLTIN